MGTTKRIINASGPGSTIHMKIWDHHGQPTYRLGLNGSLVPGLPSFDADTLKGTDVGFINMFGQWTHAISYNGFKSTEWGTDFFDGSSYVNQQPDLTPTFDYTKSNEMQVSSGQGSWTGWGVQNWATGFSLQKPLVQGRRGSNPLEWRRPADFLTPGQGMLEHGPTAVSTLGQQGFPETTYEDWRGGSVSKIPPHPRAWTVAINDLCAGSYPDNLAGLMDANKCLSTYMIVEPEKPSDVLNGWKECVRWRMNPDGTQSSLCDEEQWVEATSRAGASGIPYPPKRFVCKKPEGLWSKQSPTCHVYKKKEDPPGSGILVDDDKFIPIDPPYRKGETILCAQLTNPVCVTTNLILIVEAANQGCTDDIIVIRWKDEDGNLQSSFSLWASMEDVNTEARKRGGGGMPEGYDPECITICDTDGNEKEGYILFKEDDCRVGGPIISGTGSSTSTGGGTGGGGTGGGTGGGGTGGGGTGGGGTGGGGTGGGNLCPECDNWQQNFYSSLAACVADHCNMNPNCCP